MNEISFESFGMKSPYKRFNKSEVEKNVHFENWQYPESIETFKNFINETSPSVIIEVGTYLGWSAINMASICKNFNLNTKILCIDTWLGSIEHWRSDLCNSLYNYNFFENGTSVMFDKFCKNVISYDLENYIIPIPNTSNTAYEILKHYNISADLIYIDGDHSYKGVLSDLNLYFSLLNDNGILFGDDARWESVNMALVDFAKIHNKNVSYTSEKNLFYIRK
jgi:predicted O-methyltransferase YrrM